MNEKQKNTELEITNRELYSLVIARNKARGQCPVTLEQYLYGLWNELRPLRSGTALSVEAFLGATENAFTKDYGRVDLALLSSAREEESIPPWEALLLGQLADLRGMAENDSLHDPMRYFGISAPSGRFWYNFEPYAFLEAGLGGVFDGWSPELNPDRVLVPGKVAVLTEDGQVEAVAPELLLQDARSVTSISWEELVVILEDGYSYE